MLQSNSSVTVMVGSTNLGTFSVKTGGQVEAQDTKHRPGGMLPEISLGGVVSVENVTVRKLYDTEMRSLFHQLASQVGKASATVSYQPLDADGNPSGRPTVYRGKLTRLMPPDADAGSNDAALLELEISTDGSIG